MSSTRLLILGALRARQPTHGYEVRRELESWGAGNWSSVAYGSVYHALKQMSREGFIEPAEVPESGATKGRPAKTAYSLTERGEEEFQRLLREQWWEVEPVADPFQAALAFMDTLPRDELLAALEHRVAVCRSTAEKTRGYGIRAKVSAGAPRHVDEGLRLYASYAEAQARWAEEAARKVERGELP